jgi:hypothetical protein
MKSTRPSIPTHLNEAQAHLLIEIIDSILEHLVALQQAVRRAYLPTDPDANVHGWHDHIPF